MQQRVPIPTLRAFERDGLVRRTVIPTIPPGVQNELTPLRGHAHRAAVRAIAQWPEIIGRRFARR
jgi:DNA-binding HxlR family transcriptional regulator